MAFLNPEEIKTVADQAIVNIIVNDDTDIITIIIDESIDKMKSYLSRHYDTDSIFAAEGAARKLSIVKRLKDIVIYEIYERHTREPNAVAARRYAEAMDWLEKMNTGELGDHTLPVKPATPEEEEGTAGDTRFGGNIRYTSKY